MFYSTCCVISVLVILPTNVYPNELNSTENCADLYEKGVEAYLENDFESCANYFEQALQKYHLYMDKLLYCRIKCKEEAEMSFPLFKVDIEHLMFYERAIKNTLCILKCKKRYADIFGDFNINPETEQLFDDRKPYEYLHLCYYQTKQMQKAANAAFTYLVSHPDDKIISSNLKSYSEMEEVNMKKIVNHEAENYVYLYVHGTDAYEKEDWESVVHYMEESLVEYLHSEEKCRAKCEGPYDPGWFPDFIPSISNHFTYSLNCKRKCSQKLSSLNGEIYPDLVASHYHYLQFAYFKLKRLKETCRSVASYLLFYPEDETMLSNMEYYRSLPKVQNDYFKPYDEAIRYMQREKYETKLLSFINKQFSLLAEMKPGLSATETDNILPDLQ